MMKSLNQNKKIIADRVLYLEPTVTEVSYDLLKQIILLLNDCDSLPKTTFVRNNHKRLKVSVTFLTRLINNLISSEIIDYSNGTLGTLNFLTCDQLEIRLSHFLKKNTKYRPRNHQRFFTNDSSNIDNSDTPFRELYKIVKTMLNRIPKSSEMIKYSSISAYKRMIFEYGEYYKFVLKVEKINHNILIENYTRLIKKYSYLTFPEILDRYSTYPVWLYQKCFGSLSELNKIVGQQEKLNNKNLNIFGGKTRCNDLEILLNRTYLQLRDKLNRIPKITELEKTAGVKFHEIFKNYNGYLGYIFNEEGLDVNMLLDEYRFLSKKYGFEDAYNVIDKRGNYPVWMYSRSCGNLNKFVEIAKSGKKVTSIKNTKFSQKTQKNKPSVFAFHETKQKKPKRSITLSRGNESSSSFYHVNNLLKSILD